MQSYNGAVVPAHAMNT